MAYTESQLHMLEAALAKGERRVSFGDKTIEYRSIEELTAAVREVKRSLQPDAPRQIRVTTYKAT